MKIFNEALLTSYEYQPLPQNHESSPQIFNLTDTVSLAVSPTAALDAPNSDPTATTIPLTTVQTSGCENGRFHQTNPNQLEHTDIQTMLTEMLMASDPSLDPTEVEVLTESLDLQRLENIMHLSQQGNGWDKTAAGEAIKANVGQLLNPTVSRRDALKMIAAGLVAGFTFLGASYLPSQEPEQDAGALRWDEYFKNKGRVPC